ncbi:MAG: carboxypeptidase-like regulatory domain-containing protein, partial [Flavobacteriales bacterium]
MKIILPFLFLLCSSVAMSQIVIGSVLDESDNPLIGVSVYNTNSKKGAISDLKGNFTLQIIPGDYLKMSYVGKETLIYKIPANKLDTLYKLFILKDNTSEITEFTVTSKRIRKISGEKDEYILDYLVQLDGNMVVLKKYKRDYYLSLEGIDTVYLQKKIDYPSPKKLMEDCYGNIQLICKDSVRQYWIDKNIQCLYTYSHKAFEDFLEPLIYCDESSVIAKNFVNHNKRFLLSLKEKGKPLTVVYETWDKEAEKVAAGWYNQIIAHYHFTCGSQNIITDGMWDGNVISLQTDGKSNQFISWYLKVKARELNIQSFSDSKGLVVFDLQKDSIVTVSKKGKLINSVTTDIKKINLSTKITQDKLLNKYYSYQADKSWLYLYEINPKTGKTNQVLKLKEVTFVKNVKVHNGWVYFVRAKKNGFQKLYRVK